VLSLRMLSTLAPNQLFPRRFAVALVALVAFGAFTVLAPPASASFPSSPTLDNFASDSALNPSWITPALGESGMHLDTTAHEFTSSSGSWAGALWNTPFSGPVEAWATIHRAGTGGALLYANVAGGTSETLHPSGGYFASFGGTEPVGSPNTVSIWRVDGVNNETSLTDVPSPFPSLQAGDQIGLSINNGVIIAWYKPSGGSWTAVVSTVDTKYTGGRLAMEAIPGMLYGFSVFGGGTPASPVQSSRTTTAIDSSTSSVNIGQPVTYTATVVPSPSAPAGTVAFLDGDVVIPACETQALNAHGQATCAVAYPALGTHVVSALYTGSPNGAFAGSTNIPDATVHVTQPTSTKLSLSTATPVVGAIVRYTATVSPSPDGGAVAFTADGKPIRRCAAQPISNGIATCNVIYAVPGTHRIGASYSGNAHYGSSGTSNSRKVIVSLLLAGRPRLVVASRRITVKVSCPQHSRGCAVTSTITISVHGVRQAITLKKLSAKLKAGRSGGFVFVLNNKTHAKLRSYIRRHRHAVVGVTLRLSARDGDRVSGSQMFSYTISRTSELALF
jgi:hypothetical protein